MLSALLLTLSLPVQTKTIELYRGALLALEDGSKIRYWWATDTALNSSAPDQNFGGDGILEGGPGKTVLIQFGNLDLALGPNKRIKSAKLVFILSGPNAPTLRAVSRVLAPWNDGPMKTLASLSPGAQVPSTAWTATWNHRRAGREPIAWQQPGATGPSDVERIREAKIFQASQDTTVVEGIEATVQRQYERWYENHGFALTFENVTEFFSSNSGLARPKLVLEVESQEPKKGGDLSVTLISRSPEYERYDSRDASTVLDGIPFMDKVPNATKRKWPNDGEEVTYVAHVKNVGDAPIDSFSYAWNVRESLGARREDGKALAPGEETTITLKSPFRNLHSDHRLQPLGLKVEAKSDVNPANDYLEIQEGGLAVEVALNEPTRASLATQYNLTGSKAPEDWVQSQIRLLNSMLAESRFSFAPEGALERVRLQSLTPEAKVNLGVDVEASVSTSPARLSGDRGLLGSISTGLGLPNLDSLNRVSAFGRSAKDRYPGVNGWGDTRIDAALPMQMNLAQEPQFIAALGGLSFESTDLFSATEVASLNTNVGKRRGFLGDVMYDLPTVLVFRCAMPDGKPLANADVQIFQSVGGAIVAGDPVFKGKTSETGALTVPNRRLAESLTTLTGHTLSDNPFGRIDTNGSNGTLLIRVDRFGLNEFAWFKIWQAVDSFHRGNKSVAFFELRFNLPSAPLDASITSAKKPVNLPGGASAPALTDGKLDLGEPIETDWVEVDLGEERGIGEVRVFADGEMWPEFEVQVIRRPGQQAITWVRELDWRWTFANRSDSFSAGERSVVYRASTMRGRVVRIINKGGTRPVRIGEIQIRTTP
ncbi:MAG TPA: hypothetical protein PKA27_12315 [Fimbriimonadaceae bacterium]|nr:hypothetical protein [Fimbriimonadaceae bacterium]